MRKLFLLLLIIGAAFAVTDNDLHRDIDVDLIKTNPSVVADETEFIAYLVFTNNGNVQHEISFSVVTSSLFSHIGPGTIEYYEIVIEPGESVNYEILAYAKELVLAKNPLKIVIKEDGAAAVKSVFVTGTLEKKYIDIAMENFSVADENEISFDLIVDPSEDFYNVHLDFGIEDMPFQIRNDDNVVIIPSISEKRTLPITINIDDSAVSRIYQVPVNITANDAYNNPYSYVSYLALNLEFPEKIALGKVSSTPENLKRDTKNNIIRVEIVNQGKDRIENAEARFEIDEFDPTFFNSNTDYLGTIDGKDRSEAEFKFDIDDDVESGSYTGKVVLTYYHLGNEKREEFPVTVNVQKLPFFIVGQETNQRNDNNEIEFTITNIGDECTSVEVTGLTKNLPITWKQNSDKAAKLDEGETKDFRLELQFNDLATEKEYGVPIRVRCIYNSEPITQEEEIFVQSRAREESPLPLLLIGLFLIGLVILIGRHFFKGKTDDRKDN